MARTNPVVCFGRPVVGVILEQCTPITIPRRLRLGRASKVHHLHPGTSSVSVADRRLGDVSAATILLDRRGSSFSMQAVDQRSPVGGRLAFARRTLRHRTIRFGLLEFAAPAPGASGVHRTFTRGVSADAFVPGAVRDERNAGRNSGHSGVLSLFAPAEERGASRIAVCLAWSSAWRDDSGKSDRYFAIANRHG